MDFFRAPDDPRLTPTLLRRDLIADGWDDKGIARMRKTGAWARARHGAYVDGNAWRGCDAIARHEVSGRAVVLQARSDVVLSHTTAASVWDLSFWDFDPGDVHVIRLDARSGRKEAGVCQHRLKLVDGDVVKRHGVDVVSATLLALTLSTIVDLEHSLCFVNELLHRKVTSMEALRARHETMTQHPHSLANNLLFRIAHGKCESVGENRFVYLCWRQRLPPPECQYKLWDEFGRLVAIVDFAWPEYGVYLEFDGKIKYTKLLRDGETVLDVVLAEKDREALIHELTGWRCIRIVWADLYRPEHTAMRVRRLLDGTRRSA